MSGDISDGHSWAWAPGTQWIEARDTAKYLTMHRMPPKSIIWPQMSVVLRLACHRALLTLRTTPLFPRFWVP